MLSENYLVTEFGVSFTRWFIFSMLIFVVVTGTWKRGLGDSI